LYREAENMLEIVASYNMGRDFTGAHMRMGEGAMGRAAETLQPLIIEDYTTWAGRSPQYDVGSWRTVMVSPLMVHGRLVGAIGMTGSDPGRSFTRSDLQLLTMFAQQAAIAVKMPPVSRRPPGRRAPLCLAPGQPGSGFGQLRPRANLYRGPQSCLTTHAGRSLCHHPAG
jgi:hypothetical protein